MQRLNNNVKSSFVTKTSRNLGKGMKFEDMQITQSEPVAKYKNAVVENVNYSIFSGIACVCVIHKNF